MHNLIGNTYSNPIEAATAPLVRPLRAHDAARPAGTPACERTSHGDQRVRLDGKLFRLGDEKWYVKGLTYGPFALNAGGEPVPPPAQVAADFAQMRRLGANAVRLYHPPPAWLLHEAGVHGLRILIDVPWEKHRCFFEDWSAQQDAIRRVRRTARECGNHPAVFAISVANEIPKDIVRFYGARRIEQFIATLLAAVKDEAPQCLATYTNYPSTEFLHPPGQDFCCYNIYLEQSETLGRYLRRLQHVAGPLPLVLGEYGIDTLRHGREVQARNLREHVTEVFRGGLAGSFIFAFTDDWFTGGHAIEDWAFGITDRNRVEKTAAGALHEVWKQATNGLVSSPARVSVVVCSYNGAATLEACLASLIRLDYPDYEVILVDDGSGDHTPEIAARFPMVRYIRQENQGLSVARNVGAEAASGSIIAYTDSDCEADEMWLRYLVSAMIDQDADAMGGPNVTPRGDSWTAKCVACCPGNPSHVMLDDVCAEHVPGCNLAVRRDKLLAIGGFDPQFRQAGDDVDLCWRLMNAGMKIGYAASALVWHHRRSTAGAFLAQQKGYGRAEAMLQFKHPQRFTALGCSRWFGIVYGDGAAGLPLVDPAVYHGQFGTGLFQIVYRTGQHSHWMYFTLLEWHALSALILVLALAWPPLAIASVGMWLATLAAATRAAVRAPLEGSGPWWRRPLIFALYVAQPVTRAWHRYAYRRKHRRLPRVAVARGDATRAKRISASCRDWYFRSHRNLGREELLRCLIDAALEQGWHGDFNSEWQAHDLELLGDAWHEFRVSTATEELGWPRRFTRVRSRLTMSHFSRKLLIVLAAVTAALASSAIPLAAAAPGAALMAVIVAMLRGRRRCWKALDHLVGIAGQQAGLDPVAVSCSASRAKRVRDSGPRSAMADWWSERGDLAASLGERQ